MKTTLCAALSGERLGLQRLRSGVQEAIWRLGSVRNTRE
jgi:hypothetical protein